VPLKILFLTPWYPDDKTPHHGVFVRDQASAVSKKHIVSVISSKVDYRSFKLFSWRVEESVFGSINEHRVVVNRSLPLVNQFNYLLISVWMSYKIAKHFKPDIIHGNIAYPGGIWSYCLSRLISKPFIISDHTSRFTDSFRSAFHKIATVFSMRRAKRIIAVSRYAAKNIEVYIRRRVDVIPNLIHVEDYAISTVTDTAVQIGFLGGLSSDIHRKGLDLLIKALAPIRRNYVLHIGGTGKYIPYYQELARSAGIFEKCKFHGFVGSVPAYMRMFHFFVSSSRIEAFGMVIVEAMASGLPVLTTDSGGPADFVDAECGVMVPAEDPAQLEQALDWMMDHYHTFDREKIRMKAVEQYSDKAFLAKIETLYKEL
jgi:L-malate glycosyltransferase